MMMMMRCGVSAQRDGGAFMGLSARGARSVGAGNGSGSEVGGRAMEAGSWRYHRGWRVGVLPVLG